MQEQLKHDVAGLQKQLASQKQGFEEEAKAREQLQEDHERELRHLKRDIKHKLVGLQPRCLQLDAQIEQGEKSMACLGGQNASLMRQQLRESCSMAPAENCPALIVADFLSAYQQCSTCFPYLNCNTLQPFTSCCCLTKYKIASGCLRCLCCLCACQGSCGGAVQDNDIREYKHQLKAERRARKAAESWLRSELKSRVCL